MKRIIGAAIGLAMTTGTAFAQERVHPEELVDIPGSATDCVMSDSQGYGRFLTSVPVRSIQECFHLGSLHYMDGITAMRNGEIVGHYSVHNYGRGLNHDWGYEDITP